MSKRKQLLSVFLSLLMVLSCFSGLNFTSVAETGESSFTYEVVDGGAVITDCADDVSGDVVIPDTLGGYPVTSIGKIDYDDGSWSNYYVFRDNDAITGITIPESVTTVSEDAFPISANFAFISVDENNTSFMSEEGVLYTKDQTKLIFYPAGKKDAVFTIPAETNDVDCLFKYCYNLTAFEVEDGNKVFSAIDGVLFEHGISLILYPDGKTDSAYIVPDGVTDIDWYAFFGNTFLKSVTFPEGIRGIFSSAFENCSNLETIVFHENTDSLETITSDAFLGTAWYENQPDGLVYLKNALLNYKGEMPENTSIEIADGTTYVCTGFLNYNENIVSVSIPESVKAFSWRMFYDCNNLKTVYYGGSEAKFSQLYKGEKPEGVEFIYGKENSEEDYLQYEIVDGGAIITGCSSELSGDVVIPDALDGYPVTSIGYVPYDEWGGNCYDVFTDNDQITSITIPATVTNFEFDAFPRSQNFTAVIVDEDSETFMSEDGVLYTKDQARLLVYPAGKTDTEFMIPASVVYVNTESLCVNKSLCSITVEEGNESYSSRDGVLFSDFGDYLYCYPAGKTDSSYQIPENVEYIYYDAFSGNSSLTQVILPESLRGIYWNAFADCSNLESITLPENKDNIDFINGDAFDGTAWYENQPDGLLYLDTFLLGYKGEMPENTSIEIADGTTYVCTEFLNYNKNIVSVSIPESVKSFSDSMNVFSGCNNLKTIYYGGSEAEFYNLYHGTLPEGLEVIFTDSPIDEPSTEEPTTKKPEPTTSGPAVEEPTTEPVTKAPEPTKPATTKPATTKPATTKPATNEPTTVPVSQAPAKNLVVKDAQGITVTEDGDSKTVTADTVNNAGLTVSELKAKFENRTVAIVSKSGETLADDARVGTGCKIQVLDQKDNVLSEYTVVVPMDVNGDAAITAQDARLTLRTTALLEKIDAPAVQAANVDGKDGLSAADARKILRKSAHLD